VGKDQSRDTFRRLAGKPLGENVTLICFVGRKFVTLYSGWIPLHGLALSNGGLGDTGIVETSVPVPWFFSLSFSSIHIFKQIFKRIE
jgi:hypothetical protein